jgi:hypothetical protein
MMKHPQMCFRVGVGKLQPADQILPVTTSFIAHTAITKFACSISFNLCQHVLTLKLRSLSVTASSIIRHTDVVSNGIHRAHCCLLKKNT